MTIKIGDKLPDTVLLRIGDSGPEKLGLAELAAGRKIAIFGVPGAYTPTCSEQHVPSFVENKSKLEEKGIEAVICISVNDPFVMKAWGQATGASDAGVMMLSDAEAAFTKAAGLDFSFADAGLFDRASRFSLVADDGVVTILNVEAGPGECGITRGDNILDQL